ncbi:multicilin [Dryobates pubescens]|uniref:multicilin n=1 Tax=Dryobates pubescens TaxID=118200 RepID=UPI0023B95BAF|nr:multicilin [Dryobates pubescens]
MSFTVPSTHHYRLAGFGSLCPHPSQHPSQPCDPAAGNSPRLQSGLTAPITGHLLKLMGTSSSLRLPISEMGPCFQDGTEFHFQEFRDVVDDFISDGLPPTPQDCTEFDFSLSEEVAFGPCTPQLESSMLVQMPLQHLPSPESCWRDLAGQHQKALGDALVANSQLQETLIQRQEELVTLRESNMQLKELASQARQLAAVLDTLMLSQCADGAVLPPPPLHSPSPPPAAAPAGTWGGHERQEPQEETAGVDTMLREVSEKCRAALRSLGASPGAGLGGSPGGSPTAKRPRMAPSLHGAFRGLRTVRAAPRPGGEELEGPGSLRAALGEAGSIRTLAFPQGSAFTVRTAAGGYRFRWVPS